ncbi:hypothetical protein CCMA1212_000503 [Trichoderma ghanense]|uniref:SET domain-containing protein n=1 Tax=Trichoderma ghanense TaxID=65468 RepID=A0ABY2HGK4_9HYPO
MSSRPKNWPPSLPYFKAPQHGKDLTPTQLQFLRTKPTTTTTQSQLDDDGNTLPVVPASSPATETPCPRVKILPITDPLHPAYGQFGLFAATNISPGELIVAYLGRLHGRGTTSEESDYDIWLEREMDVAADAALGGNEGRFVNDYRGVPCGREKGRPNARFGNAFCERWGEVCVGVWAVGGGAGKKGKKKKGVEGGIRKGEEILVSYGKGFWEERRREEGDHGGEGDGDAGGDDYDENDDDDGEGQLS